MKKYILLVLLILTLAGFAQAGTTVIGGSLECTHDDGTTCTTPRNLSFGTGKTVNIPTGQTFNINGSPHAHATAYAPINAPFVVTQDNGTLTGETNLGVLTTGILKHSVAAGVSTPATASDGTDYLSPTTGVTFSQALTALTADSATPALTAGVTRYKTANVNPTTYTNFTGGSEGLQITILVNDVNSTFDFTGSSLTRPEGTDYTASSGDVLTFLHNGTNWTLQSLNKGGSAGHTIQEEGSSLTARSKLNFVGAGVTATDDAGNDATVVTIPATPTIADYAFFTIDALIDGTTAPSAAVVTTSTNKIVTRGFSGAANNDGFFNWQIPPDWNAGTIQFRIICWVTSATAPAENETLMFTLAGGTYGDSDILSTALGSGVTVTYTAPATLAQYDRFATGWSTAVTLAGAASGESAILSFLRDVTDTYAQTIGVQGVEVKFTRTLAAP